MIDLTGIAFTDMQPSLMEFGGVQHGALGGPSQLITRLGNRFVFALALPPLPAASPWPALIVAAKQEGALVRISEPGWARPAEGAPTVAAAVGGGVVVPVTGATPGLTLPAGKWLSIVHAGRRYAHLVTAAAVMPAAGAAVNVGITPMLRTPLAAGDVVEITTPKAQGLLVDRIGWALGRNRLPTMTTLALEEQK